MLKICSGDFDGMVPVTATKYSLDKLNLTPTAMWNPWFVNGEVPHNTFRILHNFQKKSHFII